MAIFDNILECVGGTPVVRLNKFHSDLDCDLVAKCEFLNPGGSAKDRIAVRMMRSRFERGEIKPGQRVIVPTSGNTGIGASLVGAVLGLDVTIVMPSKTFGEKARVMEALGATLVETPDDVPHESPMSNISVAIRLAEEDKDSFLLDQKQFQKYSDPLNPLEHEESTAEEIVAQCGGQLDMVVLGMGTGGTISGLARGIRRKCPACVIVGVDPEGSNMSRDSDPVGHYFVEGIGYDFLPGVFERDSVDFFVKTNDAESFAMARRLHREEGLFCGPSAGAAVCGALEAAKSLRKTQRCLVVLPDTARNYLLKFLDKKWLRLNGFAEHWPARLESRVKKVADLEIKNNLLLSPDLTAEEALGIAIEENLNCVAVGGNDFDLRVFPRSALRNEKGRLLKDLTAGACKSEKVHLEDAIGGLLERLDKVDNVAVFSKTMARLKTGPVQKEHFVGVLERKDFWSAAQQ